MATGFRYLLRKFCTQSSVLGLKYFYIYPDKLTRCFWAFAMCYSFVFAMMLTDSLWSRFDQQPTRISIETQFAPVVELPYPAITICSPNQISSERVKGFKRTLVDGNATGLDFEKIFPQLLGYSELVPEIDDERLEQLDSIITQNRYNVREVMSIIPQPCESFLKVCMIEKIPINCQKIFRPILTKYGLCCIFNSPYYLWDNQLNYREANFSPMYPKSIELLRGLYVVVDSHADDALNGTLLNVGGIRIMFHDWTEFPSDDESYIIYPHVESYQLLQGIYTYCSAEVATLSPESRNCVFEHESDKGLVKNYYRNSDCDWMCIVEAIRSRCHCWLPSTPGFHGTKLCNFSDIRCIIESKRFLASSDYLLTACDCPRDCNSRVYKADVNVGNLGAVPYMIGNPYKGITFNRTTAVLNFLFKTHFYVIQKQETIMSFVNLVANLGGVYGLCMGCSILSILEIVFFFYQITRNFLQRCIKNVSLRRQRKIKRKIVKRRPSSKSGSN